MTGLYVWLTQAPIEELGIIFFGIYITALMIYCLFLED